MNLNLRELLVGRPVRLRYVYRFSTSRVQHPETVAEHSYYVCLYCKMIGDWYNSGRKKDTWGVSMEKLLSRAVLHDMEESRSGDFPRPFKHSDPGLKSILEEASSRAMEQVADSLLGKNDTTHHMVDEWASAKDDSLEGRILEFADFLSVLSFMYEECGAGGNRSIAEHVGDMTEYFGKFRGPTYDFIRQLVVQADYLMGEVFGYPVFGQTSTVLQAEDRMRSFEKHLVEERPCSPVVAKPPPPPKPPVPEIQTMTEPTAAEIEVFKRQAGAAAGGLRQERETVYGNASDNMDCTGLIWTGILNQHYRKQLPHPIPGYVVGLMQSAMKLGRASAPFKYHPDNLDDAVAYVEITRECDSRAPEYKEPKK